MNMISRFSFLLGAAGIIGAGCSSAEEGGGGPPMLPPPGFSPGAGGQPGAGQPLLPQGSGGQTSSPVASAGSGGAPGGGLPTGTGGAPVGAGGAGGAPAGGNGIPVGTGLAITPVNGWVAGGTNGAGIQGAFYTFSDASAMPPGDTTITPANFTTSGATICASGVASQVLGTPLAYGQYWGGGIGLNLAEPGNMMPPLPWNRGNVVGFSFNVTGSTIPAAKLRFKATFFEGTDTNEDYCVAAAAGPNSIRFGQIVNECYAGGLGAPPLATTAVLQAIQWQVATDEIASTPFDFCIENLTAIMGP